MRDRPVRRMFVSESVSKKYTYADHLLWSDKRVSLLFLWYNPFLL